MPTRTSRNVVASNDGHRRRAAPEVGEFRPILMGRRATTASVEQAAQELVECGEFREWVESELAAEAAVALMSRSKRNGVWVDEGPSSAAAKDPVAMFGRLAIPDAAGGVTGGAGPIERRMVDQAQREQWRADAAALAADRLPGSVTRPITLAPDPVTKEPSMPEPSSTPEPEDQQGLGDPDLLTLADAARAAAEAFELYQTAESSWEDARRALIASWAAVGLDEASPPDHLPAQSIELTDGTLMRAHSDGKPETIAVLKELGEAAVAHVREARAPKPAKLAAGGGPGPRRFPLPRDRAERDRVVLEAIRTMPTIKDAGVSLGVSTERVNQIIAQLRRDAAMPADVDELLATRNRSKKRATA